MNHHIDHRQTQEPTVNKIFRKQVYSKQNYFIISLQESQEGQIMPAALRIMLGLLNSTKNYASTINKGLPTCIEIFFE